MHENALRHAAGRSRRSAIVAVFALVVATALFAAPRAHAVAPVLDSVDLPLYTNHPTFHWTLPTGAKGQIWSDHIVVARSSEVHPKYYACPTPEHPDMMCRDYLWGEFFEHNWASFNIVPRTATNFTDVHEFKPGTYFVHVAGHDPACTDGLKKSKRVLRDQG